MSGGEFPAAQDDDSLGFLYQSTTEVDEKKIDSMLDSMIVGKRPKQKSVTI